MVDESPPTIVCPASRNEAAAAEGDTRVRFNAPVVDDNDYDGGATRTLQVTQSHQVGDAFPVGVTVVTMSVEDPSGNAAACNFTITVVSTAVSATDSTDSSATITIGAAVGVSVSLLALLAILIIYRRAQRKTRAPHDWDEIFSLMEQFKEKSLWMGQIGPEFRKRLPGRR